MRLPDQTNNYLDGGWWPRSLDLVEELPALLTAVAAAGFATDHVVYKLHAWRESPRRIAVSGPAGPHRVTLGGYRQQASDTVALVNASSRDRIELLVIPPNTDPVTAQRALTIAGCDGDAAPAGDVLTRAATQI
jgi:hypothetical protein